jgi:hypothetical protein
MAQGISEILTFAIGVAISPVPIIAVILMNGLRAPELYSHVTHLLPFWTETTPLHRSRTPAHRCGFSCILSVVRLPAVGSVR